MEKVSAIGVELDGRIRALDMNPVALNASGLQPMVLDAKIHLVQRWRPQNHAFSRIWVHGFSCVSGVPGQDGGRERQRTSARTFAVCADFR